MIFDWDDFHRGNHRLDLLERLHDIRTDFRCTLFAVPGLGTDAFWDYVPEWCEIAVHGWLHPDPYECSNWTFERASRGFDEKPSRFVKGFKAPGWQISDETYLALIERDWWVADHPENNHRRPEGIGTHVVHGPDHWHGHIQNVCGNGLEETFDHVLGLVTQAESFELISERVRPWTREPVAA